jgi:hypothetical protein
MSFCFFGGTSTVLNCSLFDENNYLTGDEGLKAF